MLTPGDFVRDGDAADPTGVVLVRFDGRTYVRFPDRDESAPDAAAHLLYPPAPAPLALRDLRPGEVGVVWDAAAAEEVVLLATDRGGLVELESGRLLPAGYRPDAPCVRWPRRGLRLND